MKLSAMPYLAAATFGAGLSLCTLPALAGTAAGEAVTTCKNEVTARYGEAARTKIHRIRTGGRISKVTLIVRGVEEDSFRVQCNVDRNRQTTEITDTRANNTAAVTTTGG